MKKSTILILFCLIAFTTPNAICAEPQEKMRKAQELVAQARNSLSQGQLKRAIELYEKANRYVPTSDYLFAIASIHSRIEGNCIKTIKAWEYFINECGDCSRKSKGIKQITVHKKMCSVTVRVESNPTGAEVTFDGQPNGKTPISFKTIAGKHQLKWVLDGYYPYESEVVLLKGDKLSVKQVTLIPLNPNPKTSQSKVSPSDLEPSKVGLDHKKVKSSHGRQGPWPLFITGGLLTSLGVVSILLAHAEVDDLNNAGTDAEFERLEKSANYKLSQGLGYAAVGVGLGIVSYSLLRFEF